jgi:hypothetical protein
MRLSAHSGVAGGLPAFGGTHILPCMLRFFAPPRLAENLYLIDRSEVPPSGGALNPDPHF